MWNIFEGRVGCETSHCLPELASRVVAAKQVSQPTLFEGYDYHTTPEFTLNSLKCKARVVDIYDGDTCTLVIPVNSTMYKFNVRLFGIDTCEMKSKDESQKEKAIQARNRLIELVTGGKIGKEEIKTRKDIVAILNSNIYTVNIECLEMDKYGRVLAKLYSETDESTTFSDILINEGLAYKYYGGTKQALSSL
jgi:endonuclease YncB( thermonuclease family)